MANSPYLIDIKYISWFIVVVNKYLGSTSNAGDLEHYDLLKEQENLMGPTTIITKYVHYLLYITLYIQYCYI